MSTLRTSTTCLVADDHPAMVEAVCSVLEQHGVDVLGRAANGPEAVEQIEELAPEVALVDLRMPGCSGIEVARRVARVSSATAVILYTAVSDRALLVEALDAGVRGFVLKEAPLADLFRAVDVVAAGGTYIDPVLAGLLAGARTDASSPALTQRERDVLRLLAEGMSNEEVGGRLYISAETVRTHLRKAMGKLRAETRTHAVAEALRRSLIA